MAIAKKATGTPTIPTPNTSDVATSPSANAVTIVVIAHLLSGYPRRLCETHGELPVEQRVSARPEQRARCV